MCRRWILSFDCHWAEDHGDSPGGRATKALRARVAFSSSQAHAPPFVVRPSQVNAILREDQVPSLESIRADAEKSKVNGCFVRPLISLCSIGLWTENGTEESVFGGVFE